MASFTDIFFGKTPAVKTKRDSTDRIQKLPPFLGGGEVDRAANFPRPQAERGNYGGLPIKSGYQRDHTIPFSLGGTDTPANIVSRPKSYTSERDKYIGELVRQVKAGQLSKEEAITKAQRFYTEQDIRQEQGSKLQQGLAGAGEFIENTAKKAAGDLMSIFPKPKPKLVAPVSREQIERITIPPEQYIEPSTSAGKARAELGAEPTLLERLKYRTSRILGTPVSEAERVQITADALVRRGMPQQQAERLATRLSPIGLPKNLTAQEKKIVASLTPEELGIVINPFLGGVASTGGRIAAGAGGEAGSARNILRRSLGKGKSEPVKPAIEPPQPFQIEAPKAPKQAPEPRLVPEGIKPPEVSPEVKLGGIPKELQPLAQEARAIAARGGTAEEFVKAQRPEPVIDSAGRKIVGEKNGIKIAVNDTENPTYITLWDGDKKVGSLRTANKSIGELGYLQIGYVEVDPKYRNRGLATEMYRTLQRYAPEGSKGIVGYGPDIVATKKIPSIYKKLGGYIDKSTGDFKIDFVVQTKSQLIDLYNQATKGIKEVKPEVSKELESSVQQATGKASVQAEVPAIKDAAVQQPPAGTPPRTPQQIAIERGISPLSPMITLRGREATFLRERLRLLARGARAGALGTRQSVLKTQQELESMVKELLPLEERGKFLTSLRNIQTPAQLAKQMPALTQTINRLIDAREVRALKAQIQKELTEKLVKRDVSGVRVGKVTPEAQREIDKIKDILTMKRQTALDELDALAQADQNGLMQFNDEVADRVRLLKIAAGDADIAAYKAILADIRSLKEIGKTISQLRRQNQAAEIERIRDAFINSVTGGTPLKPGTGTVPIELPKNDKGLIASIAKTANSIEDYALAGQFLFDKLERANVKTRYLQGPMSRWFKNTYALQSQKEISIDSAHKVIKPALARLFGVEEDTAAFRKAYADFMQTKHIIGEFKDMSGQPFKMTFTKNQALYHWGQQQNPAVLPTYQQTMGWTNEMIEALDKSLTTAEKDFVRFIGEGDNSFFARFRDGKIDGQPLDPIYERQFGTSLGRVEGMYIPLARDVDSPAYMQLLQDMAHQISTKPSAIKARVANRQPINLETGLIEIVEKHIQQISHFKAYSEFINQGRRIFTGDLRTAIRQNFRDGDELLKHIDKLFNDMAADGVAFSKSVRWLDNLRGSAYTGFIGANPISALKQIVSTMAWAGEMPLPKFFGGYANFWTNPLAKGKFLINNSANLRARYDLLTFERDARQVMASGDAKLLASRGVNFKKKSMILTRLGDRLGILPGGWSYYLDTMDRLTGQTVPRNVAELEQFIKRYPKEHIKTINDFDAVYNRTQQTGLPAHISTIRRSGSWADMFTFAQSAPEAQFNNTISTLRALGFFGDPKRIPTGEGLKRLFIYLVAIPAFLQFIADGFEFRKRRQLAVIGASIFTLGFSNYPVFFGEMANNIGRKIAGLPSFDIGQPAPASILNEISQDIGNLGNKLLDNTSLEEILQVLKDASISLATLKGIPAKPLSRILGGIAGFKKNPDLRRLFGYSDFVLEEQGKEKTDDARKIYNRIEALPEEEKQAVINALSDEEWKLYKKGEKLNSLTGAEIYEKVQKLRSRGKEKEAFEFLYSLSENEYKKYQAAKKKAEANY